MVSKNRDRNPNHPKYDYIMNTWNNQNYDPLTGGYNNNFDTFNNTIYNINNLMNMIYPLSITAARPKEKFIYVDITPNNNIFDEDNSEKTINTKYLTQYQDDAGEGIFEQDYTNENYFYRPEDSYTMIYLLILLINCWGLYQ